MGSFKKKIKKYAPDRLVYLFLVWKLFPKYKEARKNNKTLSYPKVSFYTDEETINYIVNNRKSMGRFGDGEFMWMVGKGHASFQDYSDKFAQDLRDAFMSKNDNLLIGIPYGLFDSSKCNVYAKMHWEIIKADFYSRLTMFLDQDRTYCNASITRPYIDYKDYQYSTHIFDLLKKIWCGRDIVIVEGSKTKLGLGNDLLNEAKSIRRIVCPPENAYEKLEEIKTSIRRNVCKDDLILGALGPTASILAAQLSEEGYQFVDIGHVDIEYMWYNNHSILRDQIEGKYVNESGVRECSDFYDNDNTYQSSIIDRII